jgi:hypothetical protein
MVKQAHYFYFGSEMSDHDESSAPHVCGIPCYVNSTKWMKGKNMPFAILMIWWEPISHLKDDYYCLPEVSYFARSKSKRENPNIHSERNWKKNFPCFMKNNRTVKMACNLFFPPKLHSTDMT